MIGVSAIVGESVRKSSVPDEIGRAEAAIVTNHRMDRVVAISPGNGTAAIDM